MSTAVNTPQVEMEHEQYEQMARDILRASERLWDSVYDVAPFDSGEEAIKLENLWPILNKYIKTTDENERK